MRKERFLQERQRNRLLENSGISLVQGSHLISVDIQPEYKNAITFSLQDYIQFLNNNNDSLNSLTFLYNGYETLGMVTENDYKYWLLDNGLEESVLDTAKFYDKGYAFFRYCIDEGAEEQEIVNLVKYMMQNNINDSRDIDQEMWQGFMQQYDYETSQVRDLLEVAGDCINIPDLMDYLAWFGGKITLCGGGINECFKEVEIALTALEKGYNVLTQYTY